MNAIILHTATKVIAFAITVTMVAVLAITVVTAYSDLANKLQYKNYTKGISDYSWRQNKL